MPTLRRKASSARRRSSSSPSISKGRCPGASRRRLRAHLDVCPNCSVYLEQIRITIPPAEVSNLRTSLPGRSTSSPSSTAAGLQASSRPSSHDLMLKTGLERCAERGIGVLAKYWVVLGKEVTRSRRPAESLLDGTCHFGHHGSGPWHWCGAGPANSDSAPARGRRHADARGESAKSSCSLPISAAA